MDVAARLHHDLSLRSPAWYKSNLQLFATVSYLFTASLQLLVSTMNKYADRIGLFGLPNLGNTYFCNATLQSMWRIKALHKILLEHCDGQKCKRENCILCCTKQVMLQNTGSYDALCDLKHRLKGVIMNRVDRMQEDAHEFLVGMLELIESSQSSRQQKKFIAETLHVTTAKTVTCLKCSSCHTQYETQNHLQLVAKAKDVEDAIRLTMQDEVTTKDNMLHCNKCNTRSPCKLQYNFSTLPQVLILNLKRFTISGHQPKKEQQITPVKLNLTLLEKVSPIDLTIKDDSISDNQNHQTSTLHLILMGQTDVASKLVQQAEVYHYSTRKSTDADAIYPEWRSFETLSTEELIKTAIGCDSTTVKAIYKDAKTDLTTDDLGRLSYPFETEKALLYLNDKVINAYTYLLAATANKKGITVMPMTSFFFTLLKQKGVKYALDKWKTKINLFSQYQYWIVPVHQGIHWSMMVIDFKSRIIHYSDSLSNLTAIEYTSLITQYMTLRFRNKTGQNMMWDGWYLKIHWDISKQTNGYDCGLYALKKDITVFRRQVLKKLLNFVIVDFPVKEAKERVHIGCKDQKNLHTANETQHMANNDGSFQFADGNSTASKYL
ncbi:uncharacterized protein [Dysidea avara]|uniref:uncharacterized protein n=1 Tax=Dysidea avara TaxID=196820 RepID=UPI003324748A